MQQNRLFLAPLKKENVKRVLDVGTGTGIWAIDFAEEFPDAQVIGTDISAIQPTSVPYNLAWLIDDCETSDWDYGFSFDYVHIRTLFGSIKDWPALYEKAYRFVIFCDYQAFLAHCHVEPCSQEDGLNTLKFRLKFSLTIIP